MPRIKAYASADDRDPDEYHFDDDLYEASDNGIPDELIVALQEYIDFEDPEFVSKDRRKRFKAEWEQLADGTSKDDWDIMADHKVRCVWCGVEFGSNHASYCKRVSGIPIYERCLWCGQREGQAHLQDCACGPRAQGGQRMVTEGNLMRNPEVRRLILEIQTTFFGQLDALAKDKHRGRYRMTMIQGVYECRKCSLNVADIDRDYHAKVCVDSQPTPAVPRYTAVAGYPDIVICCMCNIAITKDVVPEHHKYCGTLKICYCPCGKALKGAAELEQHQRTAHNMDAPLFNCSVCENSYDSVGALSAHENQMVRDNDEEHIKSFRKQNF